MWILCVCVCIYSVWCLLSVTDFGKCRLLSLSVFLLCCSCSSGISFMHMLYDLELSQALGCFALLYSFFLFVLQVKFYYPIFCCCWNGILITVFYALFLILMIFPLLCQVYDKPTEDILYENLSSVFGSWLFHWIF